MRVEIKAGGKKVKLTCQDVRADSVLVVIEGLAQPRELKLSATTEKK